MKDFNIIKKRRDFVFIQHNYDKKVQGKSVLLLIKENKKNTIRCGYIVTKKIDKRAVVRNKIKRILREIMRSAFKDKILTNNYDYELIAKIGCLNVSFHEIKDEIYNLLRIQYGK